MVRFLADADLNYAIVKGCRRHEPAMDFLSANEARLQGVPDPEVLALAAEQNRILVTHDLETMPRHFGEFLMRRESSPGVFLVSQHARNWPKGEMRKLAEERLRANGWGLAARVVWNCLPVVD